MKKSSYGTTVLAVLAVIQAGCANTSAVSRQASAAVEVPALAVSADCGACSMKPSIPGLIVQGYNEAARKAGRSVSATEEARLIIKAYTARSDGDRMMLGALAGKDEIKAEVSYRGKTFAVEDYYRNAWQGIDSVARNIGELSYAELK